MTGTHAPIRLIAFYLPQFHPTPENDRWWGRGATEWTGVVQAKPRFRSHYQPHLPADLGFYDLRLPEAREAQAELATEYGISGFCYYNYWFHGRRLLSRPFDEVLRSGQPDFPFCLCWANDSWRRTWDGKQGEMLVEQHYSHADDRAHVRWLLNAFSDKRYLRVDGKPIFLIYRAEELPNPCRTTALWREQALKCGIGEILLCRVENNYRRQWSDPAEMGFDASVEFQPNVFKAGKRLRSGILWRLARKFRLTDRAYRNNAIYDYAIMVERALRQKPPPYRRFACVTPSWDNSARRTSGATIFHGSTPALYQKWLQATAQRVMERHATDKLIFINAWNEWGEGNHLEPDLRFGRAYLDATRQALRNI